jgi:hypothetical protein
MKALVLACLKDAEKAKAEERRIDQRAQRDKEKAKREGERKAEKDAGRKAKEKAKALADVTKLPRDQRDAKLAGLAERYDEEVDALKEALTGITESSVSPSSEWDVEPWGEAIPTAALLQALIAKINKHAVLPPHETLAVALWIMLAWVHEVAAHFSPYLIITAPDTDSGKPPWALRSSENSRRGRSLVASRRRQLSSASLTSTTRRCCSTTSIRSFCVSLTSLRFSRSVTPVG